MNNTALITGITGQDGAYLARYLLSLGYTVYGLRRKSSADTTWRLRELGVLEQVQLIDGDLTDMASLQDAVWDCQPDEIYNLAAHSYVGASWRMPVSVAQVTGVGALNLFAAVLEKMSRSRIYQASSSEMFGGSEYRCQDEEMPFNPRSPYGVAKVFAHQMATVYRESYGLYVSCGIMFNHESPLRGEEFVTRKITKAVACIKNGAQKELILGNLEAVRDWGFAGDYVKAMHALLQLPSQGMDLVIGTGEPHSVREFCDAAFKHVGLNYEDFVREDSSLARPNDIDYLCAGPSKASRVLKWKPEVSFSELISMMVDADVARQEKLTPRFDISAYD